VSDQSTTAPTLNRTVGYTQLTLFGLGSMLGAGIYGLIGQAAGVLGGAVWMGFAVAMVAALLTGLTYASIGSRYPRAAGAAYVAQRAYGRPLLTYVVGLAVVCSGLTSIATQSRVIAANLQVLAAPLAAVPEQLLAIGFIIFVAAVLLRGIRESLWFNAICTAVEAGGLLFVIVIGVRFWGSADLLEMPPLEGGDIAALVVMQGAVLTFFSFIGFEDMLNVSEEVKEPRRTLPAALISAMIAATLIYMAVAITAVSVVPWRELADAPGPLAEVVRRAAPWFPAVGFTLITIFAVANTALVNYVMGSRLLYGLARQGLAPAPLGAVHATRRTPHIAIGVLFVVIVALSMMGDIRDLASATVLLLLSVFVVINVAYVILKRREGEPRGAFEAPPIVAILGAVICLAMIVARLGQGDWRPPAIAGGLILAILALYAATGKGRDERIARFADEQPPG
jgi:APA family basic amino acid/polyamine antiporter